MVGKPAAAGWRTIMNRDGLFEFTVLEGDTIVEANVVSALSGWAIGVAANKAVFDASLWQGLGAAALGGGAIALVGALLAMTMARSMTRPAGGLEKARTLPKHRIAREPTRRPSQFAGGEMLRRKF